MTTYKWDPAEARDPESRIWNVDHVVTVGRAIDKREYRWPEDDDLAGHPRVRRQPDRYYDRIPTVDNPKPKPLKRGRSEDVRLLEHGRWHPGHIKEGNDWTLKRFWPVIAAESGDRKPTRARTRAAMRKLDTDATRITKIPAAVPEAAWSMSPWRCAVCWDQIDPEGKAKYCGPTCRRTADAARKGCKRRLAGGVRKYPRDGKGWYINQRTPWPRSGLNVIRPSDPRSDLEVRHGILRGVPSAGTPWQSWEDTRKSILKTA